MKFNKFWYFIIFPLTFISCGKSITSNYANTPINYGEIDLNSGPAPTLSGFFTSIKLDVLADDICIGKSILGFDGTAICADENVFSLAPSNAFRDIGTSQVSIKVESNEGLSAGYRYIPDSSKDDEGYWDAAAGCTGAGGSANTCTSVVKAARPATNCGLSGSIAVRIADCNDINGSNATWDGEVNGIQGEKQWSLVTRLSDAARTYEVWQDGGTGLLWSDRLGNLSTSVNQGRFNWCLAAGNTQAASVGLECSIAVVGSYNNAGTSLCYDDGIGTLTTPNGMHNATSATNIAAWDSTGLTDSEQNNIVRAKGNLTNITWRLPTRNDYWQAEVNGIRRVLPNFGTENLFTATVSSTTRTSAAYFSGQSGGGLSQTQSTAASVRCIGSLEN